MPGTPASSRPGQQKRVESDQAAKHSATLPAVSDQASTPEATAVTSSPHQAPSTMAPTGSSTNTHPSTFPAGSPHESGRTFDHEGQTTASTQPSPAILAKSARVQRYAAHALAGELDRIASAKPGQRNHTLFLASIAIGQLAAAGLVDEYEAKQRLLNAAGSHVSAGAYTRHQAQQTIASGLERGLREPRRLPNSLKSVVA